MYKQTQTHSHTCAHKNTHKEAGERKQTHLKGLGPFCSAVAFAWTLDTWGKATLALIESVVSSWFFVFVLFADGSLQIQECWYFFVAVDNYYLWYVSHVCLRFGVSLCTRSGWFIFWVMQLST